MKGAALSIEKITSGIVIKLFDIRKAFGCDVLGVTLLIKKDSVEIVQAFPNDDDSNTVPDLPGGVN